MIPALRQQYNQEFTEEKYKAYINELNAVFPGHLEFRIAETPVFIPKEFTQKMLDACDSIIDALTKPGYLEKSERAIPSNLHVPNEDSNPQFIAFDFGVCENKKGAWEPQLIELQAFPTLFAWHTIMPEVAHHYFNWPDNFSPYLNGFERENYFRLLKEIIIGNTPIENVILLEILPHQQKTRVDFYATEKFLGIKPVCVTEVIQEGKNLFYYRDGKKTAIHRIYNRVIFDELLQQSAEVQQKAKFFQQALNVQWIPHPNWFYRISKFSLPFIQHPLVPEARFLNEVTRLPDDLENYVIKPLFSFAGQGVLIDVTKEAVEKIKDPQNWIIQRKVVYAPAVQTPDGPAKVEIRLFYFWPPSSSRPVATNNLVRLSKGKMIGVRYNQDKTWVGGSFGLFER